MFPTVATQLKENGLAPQRVVPNCTKKQRHKHQRSPFRSENQFKLEWKMKLKINKVILLGSQPVELILY